MKTYHVFLFFLLAFSFGFSQNTDQEDIPFYDYQNLNLSNEGTVTDYDVKPNKLKITGTIYEADGITPAKDVVLYLYQHDENGEFHVEETGNSKRLRHRTWIKTDEDGKYTINTFMPGEAIIPLNYPRQYGPKQLYLVAKTNDSEDFNLPAFMFEDDDLLSKSCKKRLKRKGIDCILSPELKDGVLIAEKNIILPDNPKVK
jgi:protocatechuate 3,4-dioxygenase beta subunit